jgi:osmotically-inducible protein OsmY
MNDLQLKQAVIDELEFDPVLDAAHITAFVHDGVVTLAGYVSDYAQKHAASEAARRIRGVRAVAQNIEVRLPSDRKIADDEIAARAVRLLQWDLHLPPDSIRVTVESGIVILEGEVQWDFQRREAEADMRKLGGVAAVRNLILVKPRANVENVQERIRSAFERAADLEADRVSVHVEPDGTVRLSGVVHTMLERARAENAAWSAPGVSKIVNQLEVA